jgi:hypothetical protein
VPTPLRSASIFREGYGGVSKGEAERPRLEAAGEARRKQREARLARALRDNLRRRKADLASRDATAASPGATPGAKTRNKPER